LPHETFIIAGKTCRIQIEIVMGSIKVGWHQTRNPLLVQLPDRLSYFSNSIPLVSRFKVPVAGILLLMVVAQILGWV
jgi:hypothetical protein